MLEQEDDQVRTQRALILQGGGALGAYEVGVIKAFCERLSEDDRRTNRKGPLFDIIAGSSIGAVNAALLASSVIKHIREGNLDRDKVWKSAVDVLEKFWLLVSVPTWWPENPFFDMYWNGLKYTRENQNIFIENQTRFFSSIFGDLGDIYKCYPFNELYFFDPRHWGRSASAEAARRYYSYQSSLWFGVHSVLYPVIFQPDFKFYNPLGVWFRFDNSKLNSTIRDYWDYEKFPIKTTKSRIEDDGHNKFGTEPRLLLVSTDVKDLSTPVVFDSYAKEDDICKTEYGDEKFKKWVYYEDGITIDHVVASMSTHQRLHFSSFEVVNENVGQENAKERRYFWDGAYISNTPLPEVIRAHSSYWKTVMKSNDVPPLELYIINLYPSIDARYLNDSDTIRDREIDIKFHYRSKADLRAAIQTSDLVRLINNLRKELKGATSQQKIDGIMNIKMKSRERGASRKSYGEFLDCQVPIRNAIYIERRNDPDTIFGKAFEFSKKTIEVLQHEGYMDASVVMKLEKIKQRLYDLKKCDLKDSGKSERLKSEVDGLGEDLSAVELAYRHYDDGLQSSIDEIMDKLKKIQNEVVAEDGDAWKIVNEILIEINKLAISFIVYNTEDRLGGDIVLEYTREPMKPIMKQLEILLVNSMDNKKTKQLVGDIVKKINDINSERLDDLRKYAKKRNDQLAEIIESRHNPKGFGI